MFLGRIKLYLEFVFLVYLHMFLAGVNQLVQDETVQALLGMNQKHILFPAHGFFSPFLCPKIFPPTSLTSFSAHSISTTQESSRA
jgi:hypothetical protein